MYIRIKIINKSILRIHIFMATPSELLYSITLLLIFGMLPVLISFTDEISPALGIVGCSISAEKVFASVTKFASKDANSGTIISLNSGIVPTLEGDEPTGLVWIAFPATIASAPNALSCETAPTVTGVPISGVPALTKSNVNPTLLLVGSTDNPLIPGEATFSFGVDEKLTLDGIGTGVALL